MARCVAMGKRMIGWTPDYSVCFQKHTHTHTRTHLASAGICWLIAVVLWVKLFKWKCKVQVHHQNSDL